MGAVLIQDTSQVYPTTTDAEANFVAITGPKSTRCLTDYWIKLLKGPATSDVTAKRLRSLPVSGAQTAMVETTALVGGQGARASVSEFIEFVCKGKSVMEIAQQNFESPSTAILGDVLQAVGQRMR